MGGSIQIESYFDLIFPQKTKWNATAVMGKIRDDKTKCLSKKEIVNSKGSTEKPK